MMLVIVCALILDQLFGEPRRWHPLVGFGRCATWLELRFNNLESSRSSFVIGLFCVLILVLPATCLTVMIGELAADYRGVFDVAIVYWAVGFKSLREHTAPIVNALRDQRVESARSAIARIVSRDTESMSEQQIVAATVESTLENGCDTLFGVIFWYLVAGAPLVVAYRLINTLDAMWGYRIHRFEYFGKSAAKLDDLFNYLPARLTAISYACCGHFGRAVKSWRRYASTLPSPNAGLVMSAGAGSLNVRLGGPAYYHNKRTEKPYFGGAKIPQIADIRRANQLLIKAAALWLTAALAGGLALDFIKPGAG